MTRWMVLGFAVTLGGAAGAELPTLIDAAKNSDRSALRALLKPGVDVNAAVNATGGDGTTALHWASYRDDLESADLLIRAGANVNAANDLGVTPLWTATQNGSAAMTRRLLEAGANPNAKLASGETLVMTAARSGKADVVELLLAKGGDANARATRGQTALMWAVAQQHPEVVKVLIARGADIQARSKTWNEVMAVPPHGRLEYNKNIPQGGETALMFAARYGDLASAKLLLAAGAKVNDTDAWGISATTLAAHSGFGDIVNLLLEKGADPNLAEPGFTALHIAIMRRDEKMAAALLEHGANPNTTLKTWTPTRRSSKDYHFEPALIGATPFWLAARFTQPNVMRMLMQRGADPLFVQHSDYFLEARMQHRTEVATVLLAVMGMGGGAAWFQPPRTGREALALEAVKMLVEAGVDVNAANTDGRTALDAAQTLKYEAVAAFLIEQGGRTGKGASTGSAGR